MRIMAARGRRYGGQPYLWLTICISIHHRIDTMSAGCWPFRHSAIESIHPDNAMLSVGVLSCWSHTVSLNTQNFFFNFYFFAF